MTDYEHGWEIGYQSCLEAMAGVLLPEGIEVVWSKVPYEFQAGVDRHNKRAKEMRDKKLDTTGETVAQSNQSNETSERTPT